MLPSDHDRLKTNIAETIRNFHTLQEAVSNLAQMLNIQAPSDVHEREKFHKTAQRVVNAPNLRGVDLKSDGWIERREDLADLLDAGSQLSNLHDLYDGILTPDAWDSDMRDIRQALVTKGRKFWRALSGEFRKAKKQLAGLCRSNIPSKVETQLELVDTILASQHLGKTVERHADLGRELFGTQWREEKSDWGTLSTTTSWVTDVLGEIAEGKISPNIIEVLGLDMTGVNLDDLIKGVRESTQLYESALLDVIIAVDLDTKKRFDNELNFNKQPLNAQIEILQSWQDTTGLQDIMRFNVAADVCVTEGLGQVVSIAESWPDAATNLIDVFEQSWFESILGKALKDRPALLNFDGTSHEQAIEQFQELDRLALEHNRARLAHIHWSKLPRHDGSGQLGVLQRQFQLKRRHLAIRQLMIKAGNAVQAIKPVFMMSPLSIASYIAPGSLNFDLVVFDEASQVRPVDALGAILRGKQAVVVGDSQQLPPTNFFNSMTQNDDESVTSDLESILGLFLAQNAPSRMLRWHYRSRHESLIAVSNREFYKNELVIFPSPDAEKSEVGLIYHHLKDTIYERGGTATNPKEAQIVAEAVMKHAHDFPELSLGVASFSTAQMTAILDHVELLRRRDTSVENFFSSHPTEPFFVKNLENVQGDERDVMFISIGYGRDATGRPGMNFGPLNRDGGERRLNVLITRAKSRCEVFTNLSADDIDLGRTSVRGVQVLKSFLAYAEKGELSELPTESSRTVDSPFQIAVADRLVALGYDVRQEIGSAGFFIDIAIVDPDHPGRYFIGIECDGATYHSPRSARDRDRLREEVLNNLGWRIHHIWSTDWFNNPERELRKTVEAIEQAKVYQIEKPKIPTQPESDTPPIARTEEDNATTRIDEIPEYQLAQIRLATRGLDLHEVPIPRIADAIIDIVRVESPVHVDEVARRIVDAARVARIGHRIRIAVDSAIERSVKIRKIRKQKDFLWIRGMNESKPRNRSQLPQSSKKLSLIAPEEIASAILHVVAGSYGIDLQEAPKVVGELLGFGRVSSDMRDGINKVIKNMVRRKRLTQDGNHLLIPKASGK